MAKSAVIQEYCGAHIIFYNQDEQPYRVRFSIMHEFGHYILGQMLDLGIQELLRLVVLVYLKIVQ